MSLGELPGLDVLARLDSFDFAWLFSRPLLFDLSIATTLVLVGIAAIWIAGHVADFRERVAQAFRVMSPPTRYLGRVVPWQAADWTLRIVTIWFLLDAFDIPQTLENAGLVQVSSSVATLFPDHTRRHRNGAGVPAVRAERSGVRIRPPRLQRRREAHADAHERRRRIHGDCADAAHRPLPQGARAGTPRAAES